MAVAYQTFEKGWSDEVQIILDQYRPTSRGPDRRGLEWHLLQQRVQKPDCITLAGHTGPVNELAVFPDHRRLASVGDDGTLRIWDLQSQALVCTLKLDGDEIHSVAVSPDGRFVAAGSDKVFLCNLAQNYQVKEIFRSDHGIESLVFHPDGEHLAAGSHYHDVCLLSLDGDVVKRIPCTARVESLEYVAGDPVLLIPNRRPGADEKPLGIVQVWDDELISVKQELDGSRAGRPGQITIARTSPCGKFVAAGERYRSRTFFSSWLPGAF